MRRFRVDCWLSNSEDLSIRRKVIFKVMAGELFHDRNVGGDEKCLCFDLLFSRQSFIHIEIARSLNLNANAIDHVIIGECFINALRGIERNEGKV